MIESKHIKDRALFEGFNKVGIVGAESLEDEGRRLREWLAHGHHGEMRWMARDVHQRISPHEIFPPARSVVVVALNYFTPHQHQENPATGKVSRYAWGDDYHDVVKEKLSSLLTWIKEQDPQVEGKICVDIQPTMDKAWAVRAGLGWLGKHSNVITPEYGSWVFIGELFLNLELARDDVPMEDHCGTCTLCIDACPTSAITEPYVVDSNKCISYATIELRAPELPDEIEGNLSGWLYGCDICQDVCPWNRFEEATPETRFGPRDGNIDADLGEILELTPETYANRFRGSAMKRTKLAGLQRNARALSTDYTDSM
ncbi:MAG TPA: tRNA epoxyqueuosine(34) reductase QueG [Pyrinomonadaceae bacterium]|nr:tRNA epoxyqueuosine(34) reductase QueG [Pyrinomonadaceae bacterium]